MSTQIATLMTNQTLNASKFFMLNLQVKMLMECTHEFETEIENHCKHDFAVFIIC